MTIPKFSPFIDYTMRYCAKSVWGTIWIKHVVKSFKINFLSVILLFDFLFFVCFVMWTVTLKKMWKLFLWKVIWYLRSQLTVTILVEKFFFRKTIFLFFLWFGRRKRLEKFDLIELFRGDFLVYLVEWGG